MKATRPHPAKQAPVVTRDEEKGELTIEVDKTKAKKPYRFFSYSTARKVGIALTSMGGALLSMNSLTMRPETMHIEIYIFFIPGLLVIFAGSFAIRATKVKRRNIRYCLVMISVVFCVLGLLGALAVESKACLLLMKMKPSELIQNILVVLLQVVALAIIPTAILQMIIGLDSIFCGKHRPGYSMTMRVVYKIERSAIPAIEDAAAQDQNPADNDLGVEETLPVQLQETLPLQDAIISDGKKDAKID